MSVAQGRREWHLITGEYPPQHGGVSDYSRHVAEGLASAGEAVHVWCPPTGGPTPGTEHVFMHREPVSYAPSDLQALGSDLDRFQAPRRLLVQWVPHAYGYQSMNLAFCAWLWRRARVSGDQVYLMVHEAAVEFEGSWKQHVVAGVHRVMIAILLQAADHVWVGTPAWEQRMRPYRLQRRTSFDWLPVPNNVPRVVDAEATREVRSRYATNGARLVGHFGTYGRLIAPLLDDLLPPLLGGSEEVRVLLLGRGAAAYKAELLRTHPGLAERIIAPADLDDRDLSVHIAACDLLVQPYPEGVNSRRGSAMAAVGHGRPMATTSGEYTEPIWREYAAALLVPRGSMAALARETLRVLEDPVELQRLAAAAERLYGEKFDVGFTVAAIRAAGDALGDRARGARRV